jgi:hypothetical protein
MNSKTSHDTMASRQARCGANELTGAVDRGSMKLAESAIATDQQRERNQ